MTNVSKESVSKLATALHCCNVNYLFQFYSVEILYYPKLLLISNFRAFPCFQSFQLSCKQHLSSYFFCLETSKIFLLLLLLALRHKSCLIPAFSMFVFSFYFLKFGVLSLILLFFASFSFILFGAWANLSPLACDQRILDMLMITY